MCSFSGIITGVIHWFPASPAWNYLGNLVKRPSQFGEQLQERESLHLRTAARLKQKVTANFLGLEAKRVEAEPCLLFEVPNTSCNDHRMRSVSATCSAQLANRLPEPHLQRVWKI